MSWEQLDLELAEMFDSYTWRHEECVAAIEDWCHRTIVRRRKYWREYMRTKRANGRRALGLPPAKKYQYGLSKAERAAKKRREQNARWRLRRIAAGFPAPRTYRRGVTVEQRREENRIRVANQRSKKRSAAQQAV